MKKIFKTFKNSQKIRVIAGDVQVITHVKDTVDFAIRSALAEIDRMRVAGDSCLGITGTWQGKSVQVDLMN